MRIVSNLAASSERSPVVGSHVTPLPSLSSTNISYHHKIWCISHYASGFSWDMFQLARRKEQLEVIGYGRFWV